MFLLNIMKITLLHHRPPPILLIPLSIMEMMAVVMVLVIGSVVVVAITVLNFHKMVIIERYMYIVWLVGRDDVFEILENFDV